jgi:hypothetical protein
MTRLMTNKVDARSIAGRLLARSSVTDAPRLLHDFAAERVLADGLSTDLDSAFELTEPLLGEIATLIALDRSRAESAGETWTIELCGSNDEYVRGSSTRDPTLPDREQEVRAFREHVDLLKDELVLLDSFEFEIACTTILRLMGCVDPHTSARGNDGGIDFYGRLEMKGRLDSELPYGGLDRRTTVWLVGQAKHYPSRTVSTAPIRELVGSIDLARTGGAIHNWEGLSLRPYDAVIQMLFTTGRFSAGALRLVEKTGLIVMNGDQLAVFLIDAGVGIDPGSGKFDVSKFRSDLMV